MNIPLLLLFSALSLSLSLPFTTTHPFQVINERIFLTLTVNASEKREILFLLDISSPYSYTCDMYYRISTQLKSLESTKELIVFQDQFVIATKFLDFLLLGNQKCFFHFYLVDYSNIRESNAFDSVVSLGSFYYNKTQPDYNSIIEQLYNAGLIDQRTFAIDPNDVAQGGIIHLGKIKKIKNASRIKYHTFCNANVNYSFWSCKVESILINSKVIRLSLNAEFDTQARRTYVPNSVFEELFAEMKKYDKECKKSRDLSIELIKCSNEVAEKIKSIGLSFNGNVVKIKGRALFSCYFTYCTSHIATETNGENKITIGTSFLLNEVTEFDFDNRRVIFYSDEEFSDILKKIKSMKVILVILMVIEMVGLVGVIMRSKN